MPLLVAAATVVARPLRSHDDRLQKLMGPCVGDVDGAPYSGPRVRSSSCVLGVGGNPCWSVAVRGVGDPFTGFRRPGQLPSPQLRKRRQAATEVLRSRAMGRARSRQFGLNQARVRSRSIELLRALLQQTLPLSHARNVASRPAVPWACTTAWEGGRGKITRAVASDKAVPCFRSCSHIHVCRS